MKNLKKSLGIKTDKELLDRVSIYAIKAVDTKTGISVEMKIDALNNKPVKSFKAYAKELCKATFKKK